MAGVPGPILVISLDRTPERWAEFQAQNSGVAPFERLAAVDGQALDRADLIARGLLDPALDYSAGALGCALSHASLWRRCVEAQAPLTVCEDDAVLRPDFVASAAAAAAQWPVFDLIAWGWNFDSVLGGRVFGDTPFAMGFDQARMRGAIAAFRNERPAPVLLRLGCALGTPCYTVSPVGAARLLALCFPLRPQSVRLPLVNREAANTGIDMAMNAAYPDLGAYVAFPPLALTPNEAAVSTVG